MPQKLARLLGLGAYAAAGGIVLVYLLVAYVSRSGPGSGIDGTESHVTWMALGGVTLALLTAHHWLGQQLLVIGRDGDKPQPLGAR
ncbi:MAG TPA: hypothetical protein VG818_12385 [Gemmatimonadaceae bacterium]|jgi:hypothetical protein|nr:hypothetical protein [Gemmatimonadaceae bacterium]